MDLIEFPAFCPTEVRLLEYEVLLSYPNWTSPNHVAILGTDGQVIFQSTGLSPDLIPPNGVNTQRANLNINLILPHPT
jgi:hypothetical protein